MNYLDFIQAGFHGFAFVMFYLSYKRLGDITKLSIPDHVDTDAELKVYQQELKFRYHSMWLLMGLSVVFFVVGIGAQLYSHTMEHEISVQLIPHQLPEEVGTPKLTLPGKQEKQFDAANSTGQLRVPVAQKDQVIITIDGLSDYLLKLQQQKTQAELALSEAETNEGGFGIDLSSGSDGGTGTGSTGNRPRTVNGQPREVLESKWYRAEVAIKRKQFDQAKEILSEAGIATSEPDYRRVQLDISDDPRHFKSYQLLAMNFLTAGKAKEALIWLKLLLRVKGERRIDDGEFYNLLGSAYHQAGDLKMAEKYLQIAVDTKENMSEDAKLKATNNLARVQFERGQLAASEKTYQKAAETYNSEHARKAVQQIQKVQTQAKVLKVDPKVLKLSPNLKINTNLNTRAVVTEK